MGRPRAAKKGPRDLTPFERAFVREFLRTQNVLQTAKTLGMKSPETQAYELWKRPHVQAAIEEAKNDVRSQFVQESAEAVSMLVYLMENAQTDSVKLRAAQEILDRAAGRRADRSEEDGRGGRGPMLLDYGDPAAVAARVKELRRRLPPADGGDGDGEGEQR